MSFFSFLRRAKPEPEKSSIPKTQTLTLKEWFDRTLFIVPSGDCPYDQPDIPGHYLREDVTFDNDNVDNEVWERRVTVKNTAGDRPKNCAEKDWPALPVSSRKYQGDAADTLHVELVIDPAQIKCEIVALGNFYLGGDSALEHAEAAFKQIDPVSTHTVVILGNLFDLNSLHAFHELPADVTQAEEKIAKSFASLQSTLQYLASNTTVYYLRGSQDRELPRGAVDRLLGGDVTYVAESQLVLSVRSGKDTRRLRFTSGTEWDFLNYGGLSGDQLLFGRPIGYYVSRAAAQNPGFSVSRHIQLLTSSVPAELSADFLVQVAKRPLQERLTELLLKSAFRQPASQRLVEYKCVVSEGKYLSADTLVAYPYIKYLLERVNHDELMTMLKAVAGDLELASRTVAEDVIVSGLGDVSSVNKYKGISGQSVLAVVAGSCSKKADKPTIVNIQLPKGSKSGKVRVVDVRPLSGAENGTAALPEKAEDTSKAEADTISVESL